MKPDVDGGAVQPGDMLVVGIAVNLDQTEAVSSVEAKLGDTVRLNLSTPPRKRLCF